MATELSRSARALGRDMTFFGTKEQDLVLQTKGKIKINFGDKFTDLFTGGKFNVGNKDIISTIKGKPSTKDEDGFYFDEDSGTLYLKIGDNIYEIFSNAKEVGGYIVYNDIQNLTTEEQFQAQNNIGLSFYTKEDALKAEASGLVYIVSENKAYILKDGIFYPVTDKEESSKSNYFNKQVTIDLGDSESLALLIEGLKNYLRVGTEDNHTDIYQDQNGGVIDSNKQLTVKVDGKEQIIVKSGEVDFASIINALKGIVTDEIYSSNFVEGSSGWGIWIDKVTGESYLQVDHISAEVEVAPVYLRYQDAVELVNSGKVLFGTTYIIIDYQNEWEITTVDEEIGVNIIYSSAWSSEVDSIDPSAYDEPSNEPKFGVDRNVRPIILKGKNSHQFEDIISYYYEEDNKDIIQIKYDIRSQNYDKDKWPTEDQYAKLDLENKGRIYYVKDIWNNEAPLDFKKYTKDGKYVLNSPNNEDLSSLNTNENIVCANNIFWDLNTKNVEELNPIIVTGKKINNNEFRGQFENSNIGSPESEIENNSFSGTFINTDIVGIFNRNDFRGNVNNCKFEYKEDGELRSIYDDEADDNVDNPDTDQDNGGTGNEGGSGETPTDPDSGNKNPGDPDNNETTNPDETTNPNDKTTLIRVVGNVWNRDIEECTFNRHVENNTFNSTLTKCKFTEIISNQLMGSIEECTFRNKIENNQINGNLTKCTFKGKTYSNIFSSSIIDNCTWEKDFFGNQISADIWQDNTFKDILKYNIFQADVIKFICEGLVNNNQFIGRINNVQLLKDDNPTYGINNNIIDGTFINSIIKVDFSHNTIVGPINELNINKGDPGLDGFCMFNWNTITAKSFNTNTINHDFRQNHLKIDVFGTNTFNGIFSYNNFEYQNLHESSLSKITYCTGSGNAFRGEYTTDFQNCEFTNFTNNIMRDTVKYAKFRGNFVNTNFTLDSILNIDLLYDTNHQVNVFNHKGKVEVHCPCCEAPLQGEIKMYNGLLNNIPEGWHICDGTEGTPDLTDRFIVAGTSVGPTDVRPLNELKNGILIETSNLPTDTFTTDSSSGGSGGSAASGDSSGSLGEHTHTFKLNNGSQERLKTIPDYYTLIFIMKL
jgi:hypothetical protein